jgi:regulator of replication initiation timing
MGYRDNISQAKQKVYEKAVATKILDLMDKLRMSNNENNRRRWIWELLQNAKDVKSNARGTVDVVIDFQPSDGILVFKHNGRCFSSDNITFLIEQVSTKERSDENSEDTTGKFGTGFLTTHLLSETVEVRGIVKDDCLPYRKFCISLDRSGKDLKDIVVSVNNSLEQLDQLERSEDLKDYDEKEFNTAFTYYLDENGLGTAIVGIQDLGKSLPVTLVFLPSIGSVEIHHENIAFSALRFEEIKDAKNFSIRLHKIAEKSTPDVKELNFISVKGLACEIAMPVRREDSLISLAESGKDEIPRIFCDFPLIGSEYFGIPFIINSCHFYPTEPRDGIFLTDINNEKVEGNKKIVRDAVSYYLDFIEYAASHSWGNLYQLATISLPTETEWLSKTWYKENILIPIQEKIYATPLVRTESGLNIALREGGALVDIPFDAREEVRDAIWNLVSGVKFFRVPVQDDIHPWYKIFKNKIWDREHCLDIARLTKYLTENSQSLKDLCKVFEIEKAVDWLNQYFDVLQLAESEPLSFLENNAYKVLPNQYGKFCLPSDLQNDGGIEDAFKEVGKYLSKDYYAILAHKSISVSQLLHTKSQESIVTEINYALQSDNINQGQKKLACYALTRLFPIDDFSDIDRRNIIYDISVKLFDEVIPPKRVIGYWSPEIWKVSDRMQAEFIIEKISEFRNLPNLSTHLSEEKENTLEWLASFASLLVNIKWTDLLRDQAPIIPNQNGSFCDLEDLFVEGEPIDEALKNIAALLRRDFRDDLVDNTFTVPIPKSRQILQKSVGSEIRNLVSPRLSELPRTKETQDIFNNLILWMDDNSEVAKEIFGDLYENRHKLYDDAEVAKNLRKVRELEEENQSLKSQNEELKSENEELKSEIEELRARLTTQEDNAHETEEEVPEQKQEIDDAFLITYGVTTRERLEQILSDPMICRRYSCSRVNDYFPRLKYVLEIIARAKQNVRAYLESLDDYDCTGWREIGETYIVGVRKWGNPIQLIVRPSDNKKIVFYYPEEKQVLSYSNSELWVEDNIKAPCQITLGFVLKFEGIDCIDLPINF